MFFSKLAIAVTALASSATAQNTTKKLKWFGINESGAEFGEKNFTGVYGKEFTWYDLHTIDQFMAQGVNHFRLNFRKPPPIYSINFYPKSPYPTNG
jgi:endoglucanase